MDRLRAHAAIAGVMLALLGAAAQVNAADTSPGSNAQLESATASVQAAPAATVTWRSVREALVKLDKLTEKEMRKTGLPGLAIAVVFNDRVVYAKGLGVREVGRRAPVDSDTVFQLASVSKPVGSTVVAALVGKGVVSWDSRMADLDPGFAMFDPAVTSQVTIRDFYCHRSGLPSHAGDLLEDLGFARGEILHRLRYQPPAGTFRQSYAYTNFGMTEGAIAAAKAAGVAWETLSEKLLYWSLGMKSTSSRYSDFASRRNRALGHVLINGKWVQKYKRDPDAQTPAGGVSSSVNDLAKWMRLQINGGVFDGRRIVGEAALNETHKEEMNTGHEFYGLGWNVRDDPQGRLQLSHSGAFDLGASTFVYLVPAEGLGIVILTNGEMLGIPEGLAHTFVDNVLYGAPTRDWVAFYKEVIEKMKYEKFARSRKYDVPPVSPAPPLEDSAYLGTYTNDFYGDISIIRRSGGRLAIVEGPLKKTFLMSHWDGNTFTYVTQGEHATGTSGIFFTIGSDGLASSVVVEDLDINKTGTFTRVPSP